jgi:polysaccharide biosynthesis/export protein
MRNALAGAAMQNIATEPDGRAVGAARGQGLCGLVILATVIALPGCSTVDTQRMRPAPREPPPYTGYMSSLSPYRIRIGDVLAIRLLQNPELDEEVTVRPDGAISTNFVQSVRAYGLTVPELDAELRRDYAKYLRDKK